MHGQQGLEDLSLAIHVLRIVEALLAPHLMSVRSRGQGAVAPGRMRPAVSQTIAIRRPGLVDKPLRKKPALRQRHGHKGTRGRTDIAWQNRSHGLTVNSAQGPGPKRSETCATAIVNAPVTPSDARSDAA